MALFPFGAALGGMWGGVPGANAMTGFGGGVPQRGGWSPAIQGAITAAQQVAQTSPASMPENYLGGTGYQTRWRQSGDPGYVPPSGNTGVSGMLQGPVGGLFPPEMGGQKYPGMSPWGGMNPQALMSLWQFAQRGGWPPYGTPQAGGALPPPGALGGAPPSWAPGAYTPTGNLQGRGFYQDPSGWTRDAFGRWHAPSPEDFKAYT